MLTAGGEGISVVDLSFIPGPAPLTPHRVSCFWQPKDKIFSPLCCLPLYMHHESPCLPIHGLWLGRYISFNTQAQPRSVTQEPQTELGRAGQAGRIPGALTRCVWGHCCWEQRLGGSQLGRACVRSFGFLRVTCGIPQSPKWRRDLDTLLSWSR